jgi:hypothetical protein
MPETQGYRGGHEGWCGLYRLAYVSCSNRKVSEGALPPMLAQARKKNQQSQVTGLLIHSGSGFFQVLEGAEDRLWSLYQAIRRNPLHEGCVLLCFEPILKRDFPDWPLGFKSFTREEFREAGVRDVFQAAGLGTIEGKVLSLALTFLRQFDFRYRATAA